jgi:anti-sigma factor RsiW
MDHEDIEAGNLVERYVLGRLPVDEQIRFEEHFAGCPACIEELEMARELRAGLGEVAAEDARLVLGGSLAAILVRRWRWIAPLGIALLLLPALWLARQNHSLRGDLEDLRRPLANVPTFLLDVARDAEAPVPVLEIPAGQSWLALSVEVQPIAASPIAAPSGVESYGVTLEDASGRVLWREEALEPNLWGILLVTLPRAFLPPGEYRLVLRPADGDTAGEPAITYPFRLGGT